MSGAIRRVLFGVSERDLFLRVDGVGADGAGRARGILLRFRAPGEIEARARLSAGMRGELEWTAGAGDPGEFVVNDVAEIRVPLARLGAGPETVLRWSVALEESGAIVETLPRAGLLSARTLAADFMSRNWSAASTASRLVAGCTW